MSDNSDLERYAVYEMIGGVPVEKERFSHESMAANMIYGDGKIFGIDLETGRPIMPMWGRVARVKRTRKRRA